MKITVSDYNKLFGLDCVSWQSICNVTRFPPEYKTVRSKNSFRQLQYITPEELIEIMNKKIAYGPENCRRYLPRWKRTITRCEELINNSTQNK